MRHGRMGVLARLWILAIGMGVACLAGVGVARAGDGLLWVVHADGAELYLAGAFPAGTGEEYPLPQALEQAFAESDVLLVKALPLPDQERQTLFVEYGTYGQDDGLSRHLGMETLQELVAAGFEPARTERLRPWVVAMALYSAAANTLGYSQDQGMEAHFQALAQERSMDVRSLDSQESLLALLSQAYDQEPDELLWQCFADLAAAEEEMPAVNQAILDGDEELAESLLFNDASEAQARLNQAIYFDYNEFLADRLEMVLTAEGTYFALLHAKHLLTDQGLPALLEERGFEVERL